MTQATYKFIVFVIWIGLFETSIAQSKAIQVIDTVVLKNVESGHFKIRLPKVANIESYRILFKNYGAFYELEIDSSIQQFVGDYANIQRARAIDQKIVKQGIEPTFITYFTMPNDQPIEVAVSQEAITGELQNKSLAFSRKITDNEVAVLPETDLNATIKNNSSNPDTTRTEEVVVTDVHNPSSPAYQKVDRIVEEIPDKEVQTEITNATSKKADDLIKTAKFTKPKIEARDSTSTIPQKQLAESGDFVLLLPLVDNPEVYEFVLKDLGYVQPVEVADDKLMYYLGYFNSPEEAQLYIPQLNERGFLKEMPVFNITNVQERAQQIYKQDKKVNINKGEDVATITKTEEPIIEKVVDQLADYYRIELPPVDNPEIFFKAFEDVGNTLSEISPNGKGIYYIGIYASSEEALQQLKDLEPRGLSDGSVILFRGDQRINPYRKDQIEIKDVINDKLEQSISAKNEPVIKTNAKGKFRVELGQVDNPEVFKDVFGDIGKIKVAYHDDESEYFYLGNYYLQEDATFVAKQLQERGLSKVSIINITSKNEVQVNEKSTQAPPKNKTTVAPSPPPISAVADTLSKQTNISVNDDNVLPVTKNASYKIWLGSLDNPKLYSSILKEYGKLTQSIEDNITIYYLESYISTAVAKLVIEQIRGLGIETPLKVVEFDE